MAMLFEGRRLSAIIPDVATHFFTLLRKESELARAEMSENASKAAIGAGLAVAGVILLLPAFFVLLIAAVAGIAALGLAVHWAALIVGGVFLAVSSILVMLGVSRLKGTSLVPQKALHQLREGVTISPTGSADGFRRSA